MCRAWSTRLTKSGVYIGLLVLVLYLLMRAYVASVAVPSFENIKQRYLSSYISIQDRSGELLENVRQDFQVRRVDWFALEQFSPEIIQAIKDSEDRSFNSHWGVDWLALLKAGTDHLLGRSQRGASTITMQLVGLVFDTSRQGRRGYGQKLQQLLYAQSLEMAWTKEQILEAYINLVPLRGETIGIPSASRTYFQKYPIGLNKNESAILATMLRSPNAKPERLIRRSCQLLQYQGFDCQQVDRIVPNALSNPQAEMWADSRLAPHAARRYLRQFKPVVGQQILRTSMSKPLQAFVVQRVQQRLQELFAHQVQDAAVVVLHKQTGEVLAYVGSSGDLTRAQHVDHVQALRQAGSTLKPFLYAQALDEQRITAASLLNDNLLNLSEQTGLYVPQNYDRHFRGWVSVRTALGSSLNIPAVRVLTMVGVESFWGLLKRLGLPLNQEPEFYGYSLALGSADIDLLSLTNAYRALANQGLYSPVQWFVQNPPSTESGSTTAHENHAQTAPPSVWSSQHVKEQGSNHQSIRVLGEPAAWIIAHILADRHARAITFGLDSALSTPFWSAVKTGTSKDMRDNWTVGWSADYVVGVWVGNSSGASMRDITGVSGAGPIWHDVMQYLHRYRPSYPPEPVLGLVSQGVNFQESLEPKRQEYFIAGTQMSQVRLAQSLKTPTRLFIETPADQMIIALDPDIPLSDQKVLLRAQQLGGQLESSLSWWLNGQMLSQSNPYAWPARPGRHLFELKNQAGEVVDSVRLQVRGATLKKTDSSVESNHAVDEDDAVDLEELSTPFESPLP